jgi:hypothetical protein
MALAMRPNSDHARDAVQSTQVDPLAKLEALRASVGSTEASNGRLARVGVVGPTRARGEKRDTAEGSGNWLTTRLGILKGELPAAGSARRGPQRMIRLLRTVVGTK